MINKCCVLGKDKRSEYIKEMLQQEQLEITDIENCHYLVTPIPFSKDGKVVNGEEMTIDEFFKIPKLNEKILFTASVNLELELKLKAASIHYVDVFESEQVAIMNCIPTAEGAIMTAMEHTDFTLCNSKILILGYGRIGKVLSKMLAGIGAHVYVEARKEKDLAEIISMGYERVLLENLDDNLNKFDVIFNTIPSLILDSKRLDLVKSNVCIVDLASFPGGTDFSYAKEKKVQAILALALPAKVAPKSSAEYIKNKIIEIIKER